MEILLDEKFLPRATEIITNAQHFIFISTFKLELSSKPRGRKLKEFWRVLTKKATTGVDVRLLICAPASHAHIPHTNLWGIWESKNNGIAVRSPAGDRICHAKIIIVDDYAAIIGSHNLSIKSCANNFELSLLLTHQETIRQLSQTYDSIWQNAQEA